MPSSNPTSQLRHLWVIRHGPTSANAAGIHSGWQDYTLTPDGLAACQRARENFWTHQRIDHVAVSPLRRTRDTAVALFGRYDRLDPLWVEAAIPGYEGDTYARAHERFPDLVHPHGWPHLDRDPITNPGTNPGSSAQTRAREQAADEHPADFLERIHLAITRSARYTPAGTTTAIITHGAALLATLHLAGHPNPQPLGNLAAAHLHLPIETGPITLTDLITS